MKHVTFENPVIYMGFKIFTSWNHSAPWGFIHEDYDNAPDGPDNRCGEGKTIEDCINKIQEMYEDNELYGLPEIPPKPEPEPPTTQWFKPSQRPEYNPDDNSFSVTVWAQWDDNTTEQVWFDFKEDEWTWDFISDLKDYGLDFLWTYIPQRPA